ncbi:thioesterase family protein [Alicyclobacillus macrosporangiidus]|uniref:acyl-CoA thioesterase n=1 Tax=Alicyclobacillus macrosporangiidus TaxID=392015 RepID=UPI0031843718
MTKRSGATAQPGTTDGTGMPPERQGVAPEAHGVESELELIVRSTEIDVNGHVNNAKFLEYLEWGREDWYERCGFDYETLRRLGVVTVVAHVSANYRREAFQNDRLRVRTRLTSVGNTSMRMGQWITNQRDELVLDAEFVVVTVDPGTRKPVRVPDAFRAHVMPPLVSG